MCSRKWERHCEERRLVQHCSTRYSSTHHDPWVKNSSRHWWTSCPCNWNENHRPPVSSPVKLHTLNKHFVRRRQIVVAWWKLQIVLPYYLSPMRVIRRRVWVVFGLLAKLLVACNLDRSSGFVSEMSPRPEFRLCSLRYIALVLLNQGATFFFDTDICKRDALFI